MRAGGEGEEEKEDRSSHRSEDNSSAVYNTGMQPHGSDRVRTVDDGRVILFSRYPKNWQARIAKTLTSPDHPGTAVFWGEAIYEVVAVEPQAQGEAVRYVLEPWRDECAIRVSDRYDGETEDQRYAEYRKLVAREQKRKGAVLIGFLAGHLPAPVQEEMASELGLFAHRMTMMSVVSMFVLITALIVGMAQQLVHHMPVYPSQVILTGFLVVENVVRFHLAWSQNRPIGSILGVLVYSIAYAAGWKRGMISPLRTPKGHSVYVREEAEDTKLRDAFHVREPLVTLLTPAEQARFAERFDYDYRRHSSKVAMICLVFALAGIFSSLRTLGLRPGLGAFLSLLCAGLIAIEQLLRLSAFKRGPAGSVLGVLARPFTNSLRPPGTDSR